MSLNDQLLLFRLLYLRFFTFFFNIDLIFNSIQQDHVYINYLRLHLVA